MKKVLVIISAIAFVTAATFAIAADGMTTSKKAAKADKKIHCCIKGECKSMTKAECLKENGRQVKSCKKCTAAAPKKTPKPTVE